MVTPHRTSNCCLFSARALEQTTVNDVVSLDTTFRLSTKTHPPAFVVFSLSSSLPPQLFNCNTAPPVLDDLLAAELHANIMEAMSFGVVDKLHLGRVRQHTTRRERFPKPRSWPARETRSSQEPKDNQEHNQDRIGCSRRLRTLNLRRRT